MAVGAAAAAAPVERAVVAMRSYGEVRWRGEWLGGWAYLGEELHVDR